MLQLCGHTKHVVVLVALLRVVAPVVVNCSHIFTFHLYVNFLADVVDSHTAKSGLSRCGLHRESTFHARSRTQSAEVLRRCRRAPSELLLARGVREGCPTNGFLFAVCWSRTRQLTPSPCWRTTQCYYLSSWKWKDNRNCLSKKLDGMESSKSKSHNHFMHGWDETNTRTTWATRCGVQWSKHNTNKQEDYVHIHLSSVAIQLLRVGLGFHVVIGVGRLTVRFHHAYTIPSCLLHVVVRLCLVIVNSDLATWESLGSLVFQYRWPWGCLFLMT